MSIISEKSRMTENVQIIRQKTIQQEPTIKRVAAYCRVSTDFASQQVSLETQITSFQQRINAHPGWKLVGIYADKGLSGTLARHRVEFQRMMKDAEEGKIDYIMAKSISRFARNTVDTLSYCRKLKEAGVGVYFEEQALDTLSATSEIFLTIHAAFAQEESHSYSENMKRGYRNRFALGIPKWSETFGYRNIKGEENWSIHEEEAETVRDIFRLYVSGKSLPEVGKILEERGTKPPKGAKKEGNSDQWYAHTLADILHNEKYIGDVEMQKDYTVDCLTHKRVKNRDAALPRYYKKGHHQPIIDEETFTLVQIILSMKDTARGSMQYPFYGFLKCPLCGENMVRVRLPTRNFEQAWFCSEKCELFAVKDKYLHPAVLEAYGKIHCEDAGYLEKMKAHQNPEQVEYKFLYDLVDNITFPKNGQSKGNTIDWNTIQVTWKWGEVTTGSIEYAAPSDVPCMTLEESGNEVYINGEMLTKQPFAAKCIRRVRQFVADTIVMDGEDVPIVIDPKSKMYKEASEKMSEVKQA